MFLTGVTFCKSTPVSFWFAELVTNQNTPQVLEQLSSIDTISAQRMKKTIEHAKYFVLRTAFLNKMIENRFFFLVRQVILHP